MSRPHHLSRTRVRGVAFIAALGVVAWCLVACDSTTSCPTNAPAPPGGIGQPAALVSESNIDLEFTNDFMAEQIESRFASSDDEDFGLTVLDVVVGGNALPYDEIPDLAQGLALLLAVFVRSSDGVKTELAGRLELGFNLVPYLVNPDIVPDPAVRQAILGQGTDEGIALVLQFSHLYAGSSPLVEARGGQVVCGTSYDGNPIYDAIAHGVFDALGGVSPTIAVPSSVVTSAVSKMADTTITITGVGLAVSDEGIKLGLRTNGAQPLPIDQRLTMSYVMGPGYDDLYDWAVSIDTEFVKAAIESNVKKLLEGAHSAMRFDYATVDFQNDGIHIFAEGTMQICGDWRQRVRTTIVPSVSALPDATTVLRMPERDRAITDDAKWTQLACGLVDAWFRYPLGSAELIVVNGCPDVFGDAITFRVGDEGSGGDTLYAADVSTAGVFLLLGRSRSMDALMNRTPVPQC